MIIYGYWVACYKCKKIFNQGNIVEYLKDPYKDYCYECENVTWGMDTYRIQAWNIISYATYAKESSGGEIKEHFYLKWKMKEIFATNALVMIEDNVMNIGLAHKCPKKPI